MSAWAQLALKIPDRINPRTPFFNLCILVPLPEAAKFRRMDIEKLQALLQNPIVRIPFMLGLAAGAVIAIAGGFYATFKFLVLIGT